MNRTIFSATLDYQGSPDFRYFIPKFTMGNVKSKRTLDISSTPKKDGVAVKVKIVTMNIFRATDLSQRLLNLY